MQQSPRSMVAVPSALPALPKQPFQPVYAPMRAGPTLRDHLYAVRTFNSRANNIQAVKLPEATLTGTVPLMESSTPRLALERGLKPPRAPAYDRTSYDATWKPQVMGFFGPPH